MRSFQFSPDGRSATLLSGDSGKVVQLFLFWSDGSKAVFLMAQPATIKDFAEGQIIETEMYSGQRIKLTSWKRFNRKALAENAEIIAQFWNNSVARVPDLTPETFIAAIANILGLQS